MEIKLIKTESELANLFYETGYDIREKFLDLTGDDIFTGEDMDLLDFIKVMMGAERDLEVSISDNLIERLHTEGWSLYLEMVRDLKLERIGISD